MPGVFSTMFSASSLAIAEIDDFKFSIAPYPTDGAFAINFSQIIEYVELRVTNILGEPVKTASYHHLDRIEGVLKGAAGIYFLTMTTIDGKRATYKLVKR